MALIALTAAATPVAAERVACQFSAPCKAPICVAETIPLTFHIDHNQFVDPLDPNEPPRNKVTLVVLGEQQFRAEPIVMADGTRGFWAVVAGVEHMMTLRPDGMGTYASSGTVPFMSGKCEVTR